MATHKPDPSFSLIPKVMSSVYGSGGVHGCVGSVNAGAGRRRLVGSSGRKVGDQERFLRQVLVRGARRSWGRHCRDRSSRSPAAVEPGVELGLVFCRGGPGSRSTTRGPSGTVVVVLERANAGVRLGPEMSPWCPGTIHAPADVSHLVRRRMLTVPGDGESARRGFAGVNSVKM